MHHIKIPQLDDLHHNSSKLRLLPYIYAFSLRFSSEALFSGFPTWHEVVSTRERAFLVMIPTYGIRPHTPQERLNWGPCYKISRMKSELFENNTQGIYRLYRLVFKHSVLTAPLLQVWLQLVNCIMIILSFINHE